MKRLLVLTVFALAACGGGGGSAPSPPLAAPPPTPTPPPIANTSSIYYLPLANGNTWTFASGGKIVDMGSFTLTCSCPDNNGSVERLALYAPNSANLSASFFFTKNTPSGGTQLTNVIGVENDANTDAITLASSSAYPYGVPIMDDNPSANESWTDGAGDVSTITSVGGTMMLPDGRQIVNIAVDQITGNFNAITWGFAKGVGFTSVALGNQTTTLSSFYVNVSTSQSRSVQVVRAIHGSPGNPDIRALISRLFK